MAFHQRRLQLLLWAVALVGFGTAVFGTGLDVAQPREPTLRRLDLTKADIVNPSARFFAGEYTHARYTFSLRRDNMERDGQGEMWLSFSKDQGPRLRLRGEAESQRFGHGEITIVVDTAEKAMYALFRLDKLHEEQCIKYPFPDPGENIPRMQFLLWRKEQVMQWKQKEQALLNDGVEPPLLEVNWTKSYSLKWDLERGSNQITGFEMRNHDNSEPDRVIKKVRLDHVGGGKNPDYIDDLFKPPATDCKLDDSIPDAQRLAVVELKPPHQKSSALNDLLLVLQDHQTGDMWEQVFVVLSAITVPGDVSVLIDDPVPPNLSKLHTVRFDYRAFGTAGAQSHSSEGAIWLNLDRNMQAFRLKGEATGTKVGNLTMDLVAQGGDKVYANVDLTDQGMSQCVIYDYPTVDKEEKQSLHKLESEGLTFFAIDDLDGEDCAIFVAELARGRWLHIWVDLEKAQSSMFLRTEVHRNGEVLRSTDVLRWSTDVLQADVVNGVRPQDEWGCQPHREGDEQLAELGLARPLQQKSVQLQDTLYALRSLHPDFALLEVLGLTGDVAIMVQEPKPPEFWGLPGVTLSYSMSLGPSMDGVGPSTDGTGHYVDISIVGDFTADLKKNTIRMTAGSNMPDATNLTIALQPHQVAVQVIEPDGKTSCLTLPVKDSDENDEQPLESPGLFSGVEEINGSECDRFSYPGSGTHQESVEFWFSMEEKKVCRLLVQGDDSHGSTIIDIPDWALAYSPSEDADDKWPAGWNCQNAADSQQSWLSLASRAPEASLPAANAIAKLAEASGVVGLLPEKFANILSRLVVTSPSMVGKTPTGTDLGSVECDDFSGEWSTSIVIRQTGCALSIEGLSDEQLSPAMTTAEGNVITLSWLMIQMAARRFDSRQYNASDDHPVVGTLDGSTIQWDTGDSWVRKAAGSGSNSLPISVLSADLQTFSFSFKSAYPLEGDKGVQTGADGGMSYSPLSGIGETRRSSTGDMRVDLASRCLYISSNAFDVSRGIPRVSSKLILRGDQAKLYARTKLDADAYDQCWMVNITQLPLGTRQPNPFQYSDHAGDCNGLSSGGIKCKERRVSWLDGSKRLEFFIDDAGRLVGMVLDDTQRDVAAGITIQDFSTEPSDPEWFEPTADWKCQDLKYLPDVDHIGEWDLIRAFFPLEASEKAVDSSGAADEEARRLSTV